MKLDMCGIFCSIYNHNAIVGNPERRSECSPHLFPCDKIKKYLKRRGPDTTQEVKKNLSNDWNGCFFGSVLWTQGSKPTTQPLQDEEGNVLLWNGDVLHGQLEDDSRCDSKVIFEHFKNNPLTAAENICGPYAFVWWHSPTRQLWFGRDVFGRQSLLWSVSSELLTLTSVGHKDSYFSEIPALGLFMVDFSNTQQVDIQFFPWGHLSASFSSLSNVPVVVQKQLIHCQVGAGEHRRLWLGQEPTEVDLAEYNQQQSMETLSANPEISARVDKLIDVLKSAVECRVKKQPSVCKVCVRNCNHCNVAVCFSGGLDSTIIALLADKYVPVDCPIDLYNVAFQQENGTYNVPDRLTGCASLEELKLLAPHRTWNFVKIDVERQELDGEREHRLADLIHPLDSVLDDSIGCALWFAIRGQGDLDGQPYTSPARVVLLGMGADEQLGGYTRHRNTLRHTGQWTALGHELSADTDNIARRNLGRDNRVVSDLGRQPRLPFLDETVVTYINTLPPWHRCIPTKDWPPGTGDKLLLRLAAWRLGLLNAASFPKRALQFGSRIANRKEKGHQISLRL